MQLAVSVTGCPLYEKSVDLSPPAVLPSPEPIAKLPQVYVDLGENANGLCDNGFDPVLGPPFLPSEYQLFVNGTDSGPLLTWTSPTPIVGYVGLGGWTQDVGVQVQDTWYWYNSTNDPGTATPIFCLGGTGQPVWVPANSYVWAKQSSSVTAPDIGDADSGPHANDVGGQNGNPFGVLLYNGGSIWATDPGPGGQTAGIKNFSLYRSTTGAFTGEETHIGDLAADSGGYQDTDLPSTLFYYRLIGHITTGGVTYDFPYNDVSITKTYALTGDCDNANQCNLRWNAPVFS